MTRINCVPASELHSKHLVAEYRELPRIFGCVKALQAKGLGVESVRKRAPLTYTMGQGHMLFFYDKCMFLLRRQQELIREMRFRGYDPKFTYPNDLINGISEEWLGTWEPTEEALAINRARIRERMPK